MELARKTIFQFASAVERSLAKEPVQEWESSAWARGLKIGLIRLEGYFFRVGPGKRSPLSFFIRNDQDLYVGLRRESITQAATYVRLVTDYGYPRSQTHFESRWMDVAICGEDGKVLIYAENKASQKTLEKLCVRLSGEFRHGIPRIGTETGQVDDALMKACHIWKNRPHYFWGVCPTSNEVYSVHYQGNGFTLEAIKVVPSAITYEKAI